MSKISRVVVLAVLMAASLFIGTLSMAQDQEAAADEGVKPAAQEAEAAQATPAAERQGRRGNRGQGFDPQATAQRQLDRIKENLAPTDEEWAALSPLVEKVVTLQREVRMGSMGFGGRRGRATVGQSKEVTELQAVVDKDGATSDEVKAKLDALRAARKAKQAELDKACQELSKVLTIKQEAKLVLSGVLE